MTYYDHQFVSQYIKIPGYVDSKVKADYASEKVAVRHCVKLAITNLLAHGTTAYSRRREFYSENHTKYYTHRHFLNAVDLVVKDGYASFCKRGHRQIMRFPKGISSKLKPLDRLYADYPKPSKSPKIDLKALPLLTIDKKPIYKKEKSNNY